MKATVSEASNSFSLQRATCYEIQMNDGQTTLSEVPLPPEQVTIMQLALRVLLILQCFGLLARGEDLQKWVDKSALIFEGKILSSGSNVDGIDANDHPMIVQVKRIVLASDAAVQNFGSLRDKELTVVDPFRSGPEREPGVLAVFFVNPLIYDGNIAVTATAVVENQMVKDLSKRLTEAVETKTKEPLNDAVKNAYSVVIGVVQEIRSLPSTKIDELRKLANGYDLYSEHGPQWREAVIRVQETITTKGDPNEKTLLVVFPSTDDRTWAESPKFTVGQVGIWLLHSAAQAPMQLSEDRARILLESETFDGSRLKAYTALRPEDFRPKDVAGKNEALIREIIKSQTR